MQVMGESVTSVSGGIVGSAHYEEAVVCTFSGRVVGLTREPQAQHDISQEVRQSSVAMTTSHTSRYKRNWRL